MKDLETDKSSYYFHKVFPLVMGLIGLGSAIYGLIYPENFTMTINDQVVETDFKNLLPLLIMGTAFLLLFTWIARNYYRIRMDDSGITIRKLKGDVYFNWDEIESIDVVNWLWRGTIFKAKPKNEKTFYFLADQPEVSFKNVFNQGFKTKMKALIMEKKMKLKI